MVLLDRLRLMYHNYEFVKSERDAALVEKADILATKVTAEKRIEEQEAKIAKLEHELNHARMNFGELEIARKKWEKKVVRLRDCYETSKGFINVATERAVITSFLKIEVVITYFLE